MSSLLSSMRPRLVPKGAYLNPALVILSVFGGLQLMGIILNRPKTAAGPVYLT